jgi:hypothetical protein
MMIIYHPSGIWSSAIGLAGIKIFLPALGWGFALSKLYCGRFAKTALEIFPRSETLGTKIHSVFQKHLLSSTCIAEENNLLARNTTVHGTNKISPRTFMVVSGRFKVGVSLRMGIFSLFHLLNHWLYPFEESGALFLIVLLELGAGPINGTIKPFLSSR